MAISGSAGSGIVVPVALLLIFFGPRNTATLYVAFILYGIGLNGLVTSLGATRDASWQAMLDGRCGIGPVTVFDPEGFRSTIAAEVDLDAVTSSLTPLQRRRWSRADQIGVVAADDDDAS